MELPDTIDHAMLPFIVAGEQAGDAGYQEWADNEPDPEVARLLRLNGREETLHGERVTQVIAILEALDRLDRSTVTVDRDHDRLSSAVSRRSRSRALLVPLRDEIDNANLALILVLVVVVAAILGGRARRRARGGRRRRWRSTSSSPAVPLGPDRERRRPRDRADPARGRPARGRGRGTRPPRRVGTRSVAAARGAAGAPGRRRRRPTANRSTTSSGRCSAELTGLLGLWDCWLEFPPVPLGDARAWSASGTVEGAEHHWLDGGLRAPARTASSSRCSSAGDEVARLVLIGDPDVAVDARGAGRRGRAGRPAGRRAGDGRSGRDRARLAIGPDRQP